MGLDDDLSHKTFDRLGQWPRCGLVDNAEDAIEIASSRRKETSLAEFIGLIPAR